APLQHRHARPALAELAARLDTGRNVDAVPLAIEPGDLDRPAQRRDGEADRNAREQRRGLPLEHRVRLDVDEDVEIARRRAVGAGFALAVEADARAVVDARGNLDLERLDFVHPALAAALAARLLDDLAAAVTVRAWPLNHEQALLRTDLAVPLAKLATASRRARGRARPAAGPAGDRDLDLYLGRLAMKRILEADLEVVAQVRAAPRPAARRAAASERTAEDRLEDVAQVAEIGVMRAPASAHALLERGMAEAVVGRALLRILQAFVSRAYGLELVLVLLAPAVAIRVILHRQLAVGRLARRAVRVAGDTENLVTIRFHRVHACTPA